MAATQAGTLHILVIGATGASGLAFCEYALQAQHTLTIYVRNPSKVPDSWFSLPGKCTMFVGQFDSEEDLKPAVENGATCFVSFAGPLPFAKGTPVTNCLKILYPLLRSNNYTRALVLSTPSYETDKDQRTWRWKAIVAFIRTAGGDAYAEITGIANVTAELPLDSVKWTIFRVPFLSNGEGKEVIAEELVAPGKDGIWLNRKDMAKWVLTQVRDDSEWVGKAPLLHN